MAMTLDQVIAKVISQDTPLPSLEVSSETIVQTSAGNGSILYNVVVPRRGFAASHGNQSAQSLPAAVR